MTRFPDAQRAQESVPSQADLVTADSMDTGRSGYLPVTRRKNLLNKDVGLNDLNMGRSAYMAGALKPFKVLIEFLQTYTRPVQHLAARHIRKFYRQMVQGWIGTEDTPASMPGEYWRGWKERMILKGKGDLVKLLTKECNAFCSVMVFAQKLRLAPYWDTIQCLELIDPSGPALDQYTTEEVWAAAVKLGERRGIDCTSLREEVLLVRSEFPDYDPTLKGTIRTDLLSYYRDRHQHFLNHLDDTNTACLDRLAVAVFSIAIVSSFVESLFSKMTYNQSKQRSRLKDNTTTSILHVQDLKLASPLHPLGPGLCLKVNDANIEVNRRKHERHLRRKVCCLFEDEVADDGTMKRFHGTVTKVEYNEAYAEWMYRVVYPATEGSAEDIVDYWRDEIEPLWCQCENLVVEV